MAIRAFVAVRGYTERDVNAVSVIAVVAFDVQPIFGGVLVLSFAGFNSRWESARSTSIRWGAAVGTELGGFAQGTLTLRTVHSHFGSLWVATPFYLKAEARNARCLCNRSVSGRCCRRCFQTSGRPS